MSSLRGIRANRSHDYPWLIRRWKAVCREAGLHMTPFAQAADYELYTLRSRRPSPTAPAIYISAGIHGDEPAATEGLLAWAQKNATLLRHLDLTIFPCLNPWGLVNNCRLDSKGRDLNRCYHRRDIPQITAQRRLLKGRHFRLALNLHEDYDAWGTYIYEVHGPQPFLGESLIASVASHLPYDTRKTIEGRRTKAGLIRAKIDRATLPGLPEALYLHGQHADRTFTIETPSEFHIDDRITVQVATIESAIALTLDR